MRPVTFIAGCGLTNLKTRPVVTQSGAYPTGPQQIKRLLEDLLGQSGLGLNLTSVVNLTPISDRVQINGADPLTRQYIDGETFRPSGQEPPSAFEVLDNLCTTYNANLVQWGGRWWLARANELPGGWLPPNAANGATAEQAYVRYYGNPGDFEAAVKQLQSFTTPLGPGYPLRVLESATTSPRRPETQIRVDQKLGPAKSILNNGDFALEGVAGPSGMPAYWGLTNGDTNAQRLGTGRPDDPFRVRIYGTNKVAIPIYGEVLAVMTSAEWAAGTKVRPAYRLKGKFRLNNARGANIQVVAALSTGLYKKPGGIVFGSPATWFLLNEDGTWLPDPAREERNGIELVNVDKVGDLEQARTDWAEIDIPLNSLRIPPAPVSYANILRYEIKLAQATPLAGAPSTDQWIEYADMRLVLEGENQYKGRQYTVTNQVIPNSNLKPRDYNTVTLAYADASFAAFGATEGAFYMKGINDELVLAYGYDKPDVPNSIGTGAPLACWCAEERGAQVGKINQRFDGELLGDVPWGPLSVFRFVDWTTAARLAMTRFRWDLPKMQWELSAVEILRTQLGTVSAAFLLDDGREVVFTPETTGGSDTTDDYTPVVPKKPAVVIPADDWRSREVKPVPVYVPKPRFLEDVMPLENPEVGRAPVFAVYAGIPGVSQRLSTVAAIARKITAIPG
ncbi:hypothetical protein FAES_4011 [Fibrella aestuarina BUZ 2]|uniref:Uncharacterized protein n=1 Tax=Fibrella aestuarina BUZ 2 TaxID=1166018 RepID=I0KD08_9BACT|nr:hypothetical protein [Fibrella aestuarina]CCH02011.1 hypothetical protein FAES_4011 [Fibrella aestuarina BUZ 2]